MCWSSIILTDTAGLADQDWCYLRGYSSCSKGLGTLLGLLAGMDFTHLGSFPIAPGYRSLEHLGRESEKLSIGIWELRVAFG